ncbi:MAG: 50S ribosomal protein L17 [Candidatus Levybacteria bacterium]|nr:50S ribosomal protein L17 [Candidatus Levybacteria bacterium]
MRKNVFGRQFKRDKNERKALFKSLMSALVLEERIRTTEEKAKAIKGKIEKLITKAKKKSHKRIFEPYLYPEAIKKLTTDTALRFFERQGGYTRIIRLGKRFADDASMVLIEWTEGVKVDSGELKVESSEKGEVKEIKKEDKIKSTEKVVKKEKKKVSKVKKESKK